MGFAISWYAVPEPHADQFFKRLDLTPTGETEEIPESLICTAQLDTGWNLLCYNEYGCPFLQEEDLTHLSADHKILYCLVEEHVMASSAELWSVGKRQWSISHEGEDGPKGLEVDGEVPDTLAAIRQQMEQQQQAEGGDEADVDYIFEIPLLVAKSMVGYKHDEDCPHLVGGTFTVMSRSAPKSGFLSRLWNR